MEGREDWLIRRRREDVGAEVILRGSAVAWCGWSGLIKVGQFGGYESHRPKTGVRLR
jgi:hypothetical protein